MTGTSIETSMLFCEHLTKNTCICQSEIFFEQVQYRNIKHIHYSKQQFFYKPYEFRETAISSNLKVAIFCVVRM
jgi:hypothetical protein